MQRTQWIFLTIAALLASILHSVALHAVPLDHLFFEPKDSTGNGKHIVLISGDEEYRSEESCPMLGKILSQHHGFKCTVLFAIDKQEGYINPNENSNIPGLGALDSADLMIIGTRFRDLPDEQLRPILDYLHAAKPVIGFRTATHAFHTKRKFGGFDWNNFGLNVIGDNWVAHHGHHRVEGGRGVIEPANAKHPVLNGVTDIFTPSDIYAVKHLEPSEATILLRGAVTESLDPASKPVAGAKNDPMMPLAWLRTYESPSGKIGRVFATTAGASADFASEDLRRLLVNAAFHLTGLDVPLEANATPVDPFRPSFYGFQEDDFYGERNLRVEDFTLGNSANTILSDRKPPPKAEVDLKHAFIDGSGVGWKPLGEDDFTNVNCDPETWVWKDGVAYCTGDPIGVIRSRKPLTNFEMVCEWKHKQAGGNSGVFIWASQESVDDLAAGKGRLPQGIEVQVLDLGYTELYEQSGKTADWFTCHGDVFPTGAATMKPFPPMAPNGKRSFPSKQLTKELNQWNHYYIRAINGEVRLWVNGEEVSGGTQCKPAFGYLCLESEGAPVEFRNLRIRKLP